MAPKFQINFSCTFTKSSEISEEHLRVITDCNENEVPAFNIYEILREFTDSFKDNQLRACNRSKAKKDKNGKKAGENWTVLYPHKIEGKFLDKIDKNQAKIKNQEIKAGLSEKEKLEILIKNYSKNTNDALKRANFFNDTENKQLKDEKQNKDEKIRKLRAALKESIEAAGEEIDFSNLEDLLGNKNKG